MINGIHHVALSTPDLPRLVAFYRDLLGFQQVQAGEWSGSIELDRHMQLPDSSGRASLLRLGRTAIEIFEFGSPTPQACGGWRPCDHGLVHLCLDVTDLEKEYERLRAAGMTFHAPPLHAEAVGVLSVYGRDPDGNVVELQELLDTSSPFALG